MPGYMYITEIWAVNLKDEEYENMNSSWQVRNIYPNEESVR